MTTSTPRPVPKIINDVSFSRKKRFPGHIENQVMPKSPMKSAPPISRIFRHRRSSTPGALSVSFQKSNGTNTTVTSPLSTNVDQLYFDQCFVKLSQLGAGSFGVVYKVQSKDNGKLYAVKKSRDCFRGDFDRKLRLEEVNKNEQIQGHPNCVQFFKAWEELDFLYIQTELCEMSLKEYSESVHVIEEKEIWNMLVDLCHGLKHLHDSQFIHMDLKPANLFLGRDGLYKIGDFGLVVELTRDLSDAMDGDSKYMAPELMQGNFSKAADIFSLGITILELACSLNLPNGGNLWHQLRNNTFPTEFTQGLSDDLILLISSLMNSNPLLRPNVDDVLHLPSVVQAERNRKQQSILNNFTNTFLFFWGFLINFFNIFIGKVWWKKTKPITQRCVTPVSMFNFNNDVQDDVLLNKSTPSSGSPSPYCLNNSFNAPNMSPVLHSVGNKEQICPLFRSLSDTRQQKLYRTSSRASTPTHVSQNFTNCSPTNAPLLDIAVRSRLFSCSTDEEENGEIQKVPKSLLESFNNIA